MVFYGKKRPVHCPKCGAPVLDDDLTFCKKCKHHFTTGGTRWTSYGKHAN
jgi:uncharacterized membrane protein YvbJ